MSSVVKRIQSVTRTGDLSRYKKFKSGAKAAGNARYRHGRALSVKGFRRNAPSNQRLKEAVKAAR